MPIFLVELVMLLFFTSFIMDSWTHEQHTHTLCTLTVHRQLTVLIATYAGNKAKLLVLWRFPGLESPLAFAQ